MGFVTPYPDPRHYDTRSPARGPGCLSETNEAQELANDRTNDGVHDDTPNGPHWTLLRPVA